MFLRFSWPRFWKHPAIMLVQFWVPFGLAMGLTKPNLGIWGDRWLFLGAVTLIHFVILLVAYIKGRGDRSPPDTR